MLYSVKIFLYSQLELFSPLGVFQLKWIPLLKFKLPIVLLIFSCLTVHLPYQTLSFNSAEEGLDFQVIKCFRLLSLN